jgi:aspartate beta-hydroxylase
MNLQESTQRPAAKSLDASGIGALAGEAFELVARLRAERPDDPTDRLEHFFGVLAGFAAPDRAPLQNPELLFYPGLTARPFHSRPTRPWDVPWLRRLEQAAPVIRRELERTRTEIGRVRSPITEQHAYLGEKFPQMATSWSTASIFSAEGRTLWPETARAVESAFRDEGVVAEDEVVFSFLEPGGHIPPHCGVGNVTLNFSLGLRGLDGCTLRVANEHTEWAEDRCLAFDDSFEHEVWHRGTGTRIILLGQVWHPDLSVLERRALAELIVLWKRWEADRSVVG